MKRRNSRKCDSFDFIKVSTKKSPSYIYSMHFNHFVEGESSTSPSPTLTSAARRDKYFLELPKIYSSPANRNKKVEAENKTIDVEKNRLLLMGSQYKKENHFRMSSFERKDGQRSGNLKKKSFLERDTFFGKKIFINSILLSLNIGQLQCDHKKILVFVEQGNNSRMVKEIFRKRPRICFISNKEDAHIVWTRFCDYEISKLSSKFREQVLTTRRFDLEQSDYILEKENKVKEYFQKTLPVLREQTQKHRIIISSLKYHNHLTHHYQISDKKSLFINLQAYCSKNNLEVFKMVPQTFEIRKSSQALPGQIDDTSVWFIKPGEDTNRGEGISIAFGRKNIKESVDSLLKIGKTALVQSYIEPLLYKNRKFDLRCFVLTISYRGVLKGYWYKEGYVRTCSKQFNWDPTDLFAHLTNDAIQKKSPNYSKYEQSNKLSFNDLQFYLKSKQISMRQVIANMKTLAYHSLKCAEEKIKGEKSQFCFQIFGYDFLIDKRGKAWLIQINTNPCLQFTGSLTSRIIWHMIDNCFRICVDPFLGSEGLFNRDDFAKPFQDNKFQCLL